MSNISNIDFENLSRDDLIAILECKKEDILEIMSLANSKREHNYVTYSKNVFIPLTKICRNDCGYCAFKQSPDDPDAIEEVNAQDKSEIKAVYSITGTELPISALNQAGIYVVKYNNGASRKIVVK